MEGGLAQEDLQNLEAGKGRERDTLQEPPASTIAHSTLVLAWEAHLKLLTS